MNTFVLGITGHQGVGKSIVLDYFHNQGWEVLDADKIVAELYEFGRPGYEAIKVTFGDEFVVADGVNKKALTGFLQLNPGQLEKLNEVIHPLVFRAVKDWLSRVRANGAAKVAIEAVYFEKGLLYDLVNKLLFVERSPNLLPRHQPFYDYLDDFYKKKMPKADYVLQNNSNLEAFQSGLVEFYSFLPYK